MKFFITTITLIWFGLTSGALAIEVEQALFDDFERVQALCKSSINYELEAPVDEVAPRYHQRMQCLFGTATKGYINDSQEVFADKLKDLRSDFELPRIETEVENCELDFDGIKAAQEEQGYRSLCEASGVNAAKDYSLCRVTETAFNELCGYQEYVAIKTRDEVLLRQCSDSSQYLERGNCVDQEQAKLSKNFEDTLSVLETTLTKSENLTESWALHGWLIVLSETLENTYRRLDLARIAFEKLPIKFHDSASVRAASMNSK